MTNFLRYDKRARFIYFKSVIDELPNIKLSSLRDFRNDSKL